MGRTKAFDEIFADVAPEIRGIGETLEQGILAVHPQSVVVAYPGYRSVNYGFGQRKNTEGYAYLMPQKDRVNLGFHRGTQLPDPDGLLEGTGTNLRHVKIPDEATARSAAVGALIRAAVAERGSALGVRTT